MSFIQADPESTVAILKSFQIAFNELLLIRIFNASEDSTFITKNSLVVTITKHLLLVAVYSFLLTSVNNTSCP